MDDTSEKEKKSAEQNEKDQVKTAYSVLNRFEMNFISNINVKAYLVCLMFSFPHIFKKYTGILIFINTFVPKLYIH